MSYIIVSDVHLGRDSSHYDQFCDFLKWVRGLDNREETIRYDDKYVTMTSPEELILLGDILELWDPKGGDRDNVSKESLLPFSLLSDINCDKIYVVGNHDDSISQYETKIKNQVLANLKRFNIHDRHYPDYPDEKLLRLGDLTYFFLHGHQYDKEQAILTNISNLIGEKWDPIKWFQDLFNITFTKKHWRENLFVFIILLVLGYFSAGILHFNFTYMLVWALILGFFSMSSVPGVVAKIQRRIYDFNKPKDKTAQQIIEDGYYQSNKDTTPSNVIVFGHTHFPSSYRGEEASGKLFINTGSWVGCDEKIDEKQRYSNTFVYLDENGAYIMQWKDGSVKCIVDSLHYDGSSWPQEEPMK